MIVVSDTSPLNYLILIEAVEILPKLFGEVIIPRAVDRELTHAKTPERVRTWLTRRPAWLRVEEAGPLEAGLDNLGAGEAEAITPARKLKADHLLINERDGTKAARNVGLAIVSSGGLEKGGRGEAHRPAAMYPATESGNHLPHDRRARGCSHEVSYRNVIAAQTPSLNACHAVAKALGLTIAVEPAHSVQ